MIPPVGNPPPPPAPAPGADERPVDGIVLAAGRSSRMGRSKAALELGGRSFLERCVELLRKGGCRSIVVVVSDPAIVGATAAAEAAGAADPAGLRDVVFVRNPDPASEQIASIRIGLDALPADAAGAAILPVDAPSVRPDTVRALLEAFGRGGAAVLIVRPVHGEQPGHPTIFARALFPELSGPDLPQGAETVIEQHAAARLDVPVDDPGVAANVNTPDDYQELQGHP